MMTVAVAARQPQSQKRLRSLLDQVGVEAHFVTDVDSLIKCVKSRPVNVVVFDLDDPRWPARKWLEATAQDGDLGLVPVVWIGSELSASDLQAVVDHRPGLHLAKCPDAETLTEALETLTGSVRQDKDATLPTSQSPNSPAWKPAVNTIEDALQIFADTSHGKKTTRPTNEELPDASTGLPVTTGDMKGEGDAATDADEDYDWFVAEMARPASVSAPSDSDLGFMGGGTHGGTEKGTLLSEPNEDRTGGGESDDKPADGPVASVAMLEGLTVTDQAAEPPASNVAPPSDPTSLPGDIELVDRISTEVAEQLAREILKDIDKGAIRRAVETALTKSR